MGLSSKDIERIYLFLLRRKPDEEAVLNCRTAFLEPLPMMEAIVQSEEFAERGRVSLIDAPKDVWIEQYNDFCEQRENNDALIKCITREKWRAIDTFDALIRKEEIIKCPACGRRFKETESLREYESNCIFEGGRLLRYECPDCGAIVGPLKVLRLSARELSDEYQMCYSVYTEGDSSEQEEKTFFSLDPQKGKRYLNYGCGDWSHTVSKLRGQGYDVYGYDAFIGNDLYVVNDYEILKKMKFDGIFSNNLLEHSTDLIQEFLRMKALLKDTNSKMAHSTPCYKYACEYTRFHLVFLTGKSVECLCEKTGFQVVKASDDGDGYINKVFEMREQI